jgi:hypothetical protein
MHQPLSTRLENWRQIGSIERKLASFSVFLVNKSFIINILACLNLYGIELS